MQTSIRVSDTNRNALAQIAADELNGATFDDALGSLLFEHQAAVALARLASDPAALADYQAESRELADVDTEVREW